MTKGLVGLGIVTLFCFSPIFAFAAGPCPYQWTRPLKVGAHGDDVAKLQQYLGVAPASGFFGDATKSALAAFQDKYPTDILVPNNLAHGSGFFGATTRAKLNALCNVLGASTTTPAATGLTVTAGDQPPHTLAPTNAQYVPFTNFTLTAGDKDVTVSSVTVRRVGPATDNIFYDIDLFDDSGAYASTVYGFTSDHRATFIDPITIPAHTSKVMTVLGDTNIDLSGQDGQMAGLMVESIKADQPVSGPLPVMGTLQTANASLQIGTVTATLGATDPRTRRTRYINDTGITFSSVRITAGSQEDVRMNSVAWRQSGSATAADLANIHTVVDGVSYPAVIDGTFYRTTFPNSILLHKGDSKEIRVVGDLTGTGAKRTVEFDIDQGSDFDYTGLQYGFGIYMTPSDNTDVAGAHSAFITSDGTTGGVNMTPYFAGSIIDVSAGAFSGISK